MLYNFTIFSKSGFVLFSKEFERVEGQPLNYLVKEVLIKQKGDTNFLYTQDNLHVIRWLYDNKNGLIYAAIHPKQFKTPYMEDLLALIRKQFIDKYLVANKIDLFQDYSDFMKTFDTSYKKVVELHSSSKPQKPSVEPIKEVEENSRDIENIQPVVNVANSINEINNDNKEKNPTPSQEANIPSLRVNNDNKKQPKKPMHKFPSKNSINQKDSKAPANQNKNPKAPRSWGDSPLSEEEILKLDRSSSSPSINSPPRAAGPIETIDLTTKDENDSGDEDDDITQDIQAAKEKKKNQSGFFSKFLPNLKGKTLTEEDLQPIIDELRQHLTSKNVAIEISEKLCESIKHSLEGQTLPSFTSIKSKVKEAMTNSIIRILTPNREIDVLREIQLVNQKNRPYSIVFVGVNGVGKSTSLSKVCAWLKQNGLKVMIAACDTFRSGAVEQLRVHTDRLNVPLYEQGYGKDASLIAEASLKEAKRQGINVVLIDTAGRMQDNEPLMRSLSALVHHNDPDLVLFVGEALVGNDGVHQLNSFNDLLQSLAASSYPGSLRKKEKVIDGVFLTKYDTIDDKVGAALSMVYSTGIPILFVGVGQHYTDIKKMNPESVVKLLMK